MTRTDRDRHREPVVPESLEALDFATVRHVEAGVRINLPVIRYLFQTPDHMKVETSILITSLEAGGIDAVFIGSVSTSLASRAEDRSTDMLPDTGGVLVPGFLYFIDLDHILERESIEYDVPAQASSLGDSLGSAPDAIHATTDRGSLTSSAEHLGKGTGSVPGTFGASIDTMRKPPFDTGHTWA